MEKSETYHEARTWLQDQWRDRDGRVACPRCGSYAQDWAKKHDELSITCEDCGRSEVRRFRLDVSIFES